MSVNLTSVIRKVEQRDFGRAQERLNGQWQRQDYSGKMIDLNTLLAGLNWSDGIFWGFGMEPLITYERTHKRQGKQSSWALFQSTPVITDERTPLILRTVPSFFTFQSTPVITDERTQYFGD